ncbi:MAG: two-component sensor histidine kinase [Bacteroidales bacterium]|jgi:signal transduction histidine kinase|nr:two-component sensor histidine kinase [Bacteroidales bacterium]
MKPTYKQKLFFYFFVIFFLFTAGIILFEQSRERELRTEALQEKLDAYTEIIHRIIENGEWRMENENNSPSPILNSQFSTFNFQFSTLPENLRITIIDRKGNVIYDNAVEDVSYLENHAKRPEIVDAQNKGTGRNIRFSSSNNLEYIYYAKRFTDYFIRTAFPYDIHIQDFLKSNKVFLYFIGILFLIMLILINLVAERFGKSIKQLKEFALLDREENTTMPIAFPDDELGEIGAKIIENYEQLSETKKKISLEREKLLQHVQTLGEGVCFFSKNREVEFYNGLFIQHLNFLSDNSTSNPTTIFAEARFDEINSFLALPSDENYYETVINHQGKFFSVQINLFEDQSFEIIINDITRQEKTRRLKQEMTGNVAHELRTPITSIRGYLELILSQSPDAETVKSFTEKAYNQTLVLSELIQDMSLITKIEETPQFFHLEAVNIHELLESLVNDLDNELKVKNINVKNNILKDIIIQGNKNLLYAVFRNLTDNAIRYAGENIDILISIYGKDDDFYYFSFADTGVGISEEHHLNRLFERFYRVNEGRTRDTGGSGLGLSIVKNAILFHKGTITVKNRMGGGLEFLFKLSKGKS